MSESISSQPAVSVRYGSSDYRALILHCRVCRNKVIFFTSLPLVLILAAWLLSGGDAIQFDEIAGALVLGGIIAGVFIFAVPVTQARTQRKAGFVEPFLFELADEGIHARHPRQDMFVRWTGLHAIVKSRDRLFLFTSPGCALIVPRRCFENDSAYAEWSWAVEQRFESVRSEQTSD